MLNTFTCLKADSNFKALERPHKFKDKIIIFKLNLKRKLSREESFIDKQLEKELIKVSEPLFNEKTSSSLYFAKEVGNMYTPSLYACLASYLLRYSRVLFYLILIFKKIILIFTFI